MNPARFALRIAPALAGLLLATAVPAATLQFDFRRQVETEPGSGRYHTLTQPGSWEAAKTAIVICDMWDDHYCRNAARRVGEMAPRMNEVVKAARRQGALIIHCPSGCMDHYKDTPQRQLALQAPKVETKIPLLNWCYLDPAAEAPMPVQADQPCDDTGELRDRVRFYNRQIATIEIAEGDAITDSAEAYYLMRQRGITNVIVMGVHVNMCVLGRPFGIRQLVQQGMNVALMRDMTDAMYNPREEPFVSHFTGNDLIIGHIERHWCPTVTSGDLLGDRVTYRFPEDQRKHIVIVSAENEYKTEETLPPFALRELGGDFKISTVFADAKDAHRLPGIELVAEADVLLLSVRRRNLPPAELEYIRRHVAAGKPLVAIRTASHAFHQRTAGAPEGTDEWRDFDPAVLGGSYRGHLGAKLTTFARVEPKEAEHPILRGIDRSQFQTFGSLYQVRPLAASTTVLLHGTAQGEKESEPVAWTNAGPRGAKIFYTSLGHPYDFRVSQFRTLLRNAVYWAAGVTPTLRAEGDKVACCN